MYGIFTYIWVIYGVNVGKYSIHGAYGLLKLNYSDKLDQKKLLYIRLYSDDYESETVILSDH